MNNNNLHIERLKLIRKHVSFNYNINDIKNGQLSNYDKRKIKKYYDAISEMQASPKYQYRPRNNERRKAAEKFANQSGLKEFKTVFIPTKIDGVKPDLIFNKDGLTVFDGYTEKRAALFNKDLLIKDVNKAVNKAKRELTGATHFTVMCGEHESIKTISSAGTINDLISKYQTQYKNSGKWLNGIYGYKTRNQSNFEEYMSAKKNEREKFQAVKKRDRNRNKKIDKINHALEYATDKQAIKELKDQKKRLSNLLGK